MIGIEPMGCGQIIPKTLLGVSKWRRRQATFLIERLTHGLNESTACAINWFVLLGHEDAD